MTTAHPRPVPHPTPTSQPYWDACRRHELIVQRCQDCGRYVFIPQSFCRFCFGDRLEWTPASGRGTVYSYTIVWRPQTPAFEVPYVIAVLDMEEGYQMLSNVVECPVEDVRVGMPVEVMFEDVTEEISLPKFRPRRA